MNSTSSFSMKNCGRIREHWNTVEAIARRYRQSRWRGAPDGIAHALCTRQRDLKSRTFESPAKVVHLDRLRHLPCV